MVTDRERRLLDYLDARRDEMIAFTAELVAIPSMNPEVDERGVAAALVDRMAALGLPRPETFAMRPERPNLVCRLPGRGGRRVMLCGHMDTKPVGDAAPLWRTDPLQPTIVDGRMYGLGTSDMKGPDVAMLYAVAALAHGEEPLRGEVQLVFTADEERGSVYGAYYLANERLVSADIAMLAEPCGLRRDFEALDLVSRGITCFVVKVYGTQGHSSISDQFALVNASVKMAHVLDRMATDLRLTFTPHPLCATGPTINPGVVVKGGVAYGVTPGYAEFWTDVRTLPGMTRAQIEADVAAFLDQLRAEDPDLRVEVEFGQSADPTEVSPDEPFVAALQDAAADVIGERPPLGTFPGGTDARAFQGIAGIPTIPAFGPGLLPHCHGPNEYITVEAIVQAAKIYALALDRHLR